MNMRYYYPSQMTLITLVVILMPVFFSGCDLLNMNMGSIEQWYISKLKEHKGNNTNQVIVPVKPLHVISFNSNSPNPFDARNLIRVESNTELSISDPNRPDMSRLRQPLESYPITSLLFVGTILQPPPALDIALISANGSIYQVKVGDFLGQNFGQIKKIRDTEVVIHETLKNARNRWEIKERTLILAGLSKESLR